jgi:hypothetical protein
MWITRSPSKAAHMLKMTTPTSKFIYLQLISSRPNVRLPSKLFSKQQSKPLSTRIGRQDVLGVR